MHVDDQTLLQAYAREGAHDAFTALVQRHLNLVYSAARRQVRSHDLAQEVTQLVFIALARKAHRIAPGTPLAAWLYLVTRRTALDLLRREARRRVREHAAAQEFSAMKFSPDWPAIEPWLDEAMATLSKADGSALLLRFFENKSLREVGEALGISEDAAQKRVSRALEQLRVVFSRKGFTTTAAGLATQLSAHAVEIAPVGVGAAVSTATLAAAGATVGEGWVTLVMTTLQKNVLITAMALAAGAALYQGVGLQRTSAAAREVDADAAASRAEIARLRASREATAARLVTVEREIDTRLAGTREAVPAADEEALSLIDERLEKIEKIDRFLAERPEFVIPELQLLPRWLWNRFVLEAKVETAADIRRVTALLRENAQMMVTGRLMDALSLYIKANAGRLPDSVAELAPFLYRESNGIVLPPTILERYEMVRTGLASDVPLIQPSGRRTFVIMPKSVADMEYDKINWVGLDSVGPVDPTVYNLMVARERFSRAQGRQATRPEELEPYLKWPVSSADLRRHWETETTRGRH